MMTRRLVAKGVRCDTPTFALTLSIQVLLALANTSAVPSDSICPANPSEGPKLNATVTPGCPDSKSAPIFVKAPVREDAANTMMVVVGWLVPGCEEHAGATSTSQIIARKRGRANGILGAIGATG